MHDFRSHFQQDFLAYCTRPVYVHLVMVCVSCSFDSFSMFLLSLKQQQNLMKIMFSCIHFPIWPYPPRIMKKLFYTGKLYGLTGMHSRKLESVLVICAELDSWPSTQPWPDTRTAPWMSCIMPPWPACEGRSSSKWTLPTVFGFHGSCWLLSRQSAFLRVCHEQWSFVGTLQIWKVNVILTFLSTFCYSYRILMWSQLNGFGMIHWHQMTTIDLQYWLQ